MQSAPIIFGERATRRLARRIVIAAGALLVVTNAAQAQAPNGCSFRNVGACGGEMDQTLETLRRLRSENRSLDQRSAGDRNPVAGGLYVDAQGRIDPQAAMRALCSYPQQSLMSDPADPQDPCAPFRSPAPAPGDLPAALPPASSTAAVPPLAAPPVTPSRRPAPKPKPAAARALESVGDPAPATSGAAQQKARPKPPRDIRPVLPK